MQYKCIVQFKENFLKNMITACIYVVIISDITGEIKRMRTNSGKVKKSKKIEEKFL